MTLDYEPPRGVIWQPPPGFVRWFGLVLLLPGVYVNWYVGGTSLVLLDGPVSFGRTLTGSLAVTGICGGAFAILALVWGRSTRSIVFVLTIILPVAAWVGLLPHIAQELWLVHQHGWAPTANFAEPRWFQPGNWIGYSDGWYGHD